MRQLETLIKMHKFFVDEQRRVLTEKQSEANSLMMAIAALQANMETEKERAAQREQQEGSFVLGAYINEQLKRHAKLQQDLSEKEREVELERQKLSLLFEELKRYEIAQKNWQEEQDALARKTETKTYDEQASNRHHRGTT